MRRLLAVSAAVLVLAACEKKEDEGTTAANAAAHADSVKAGITMMNTAFANHMKAGHVDSVVAMYAPSGTVMPPNMPAMHGTDAIKAGFTAMMAEGKPSDFTLTSTEVNVAGDMAVERGKYTFGMMGPNHQMMADSGSYLVHWHRLGNTWKIMDDIWNSSKAPMAMPAAAARHRS